MVSPLSGLIRRTADKCRVGIPPRNMPLAFVDVRFTRAEFSVLLDDFAAAGRHGLVALDVGAVPVLIRRPAMTRL